MAVTPQEELQVGHFHLLKRNDAEAWRWYEQAQSKLPAARPPQNWTEFTQHISAPEKSQVFEFLCLKRLGRDDEAHAKWQEFEQTFFPVTPENSETPMPDVMEAWLKTLGSETELLKHLIHDLYVAEVFLSVDALDEALTHFRAEPSANIRQDAAVSRAIVLAQLLLIAGDHDGYLSHCTSVVAPLAIDLWTSSIPQTPENTHTENAHGVLRIAVGLCLAPLFRADFLSEVSAAALQKNLSIWKDRRVSYEEGLPAVAADLVLRAAALQRNDLIDAKVFEERITRNASGQLLFAGKPIDDVLTSWFAFSQSSLALSANRR